MKVGFLVRLGVRPVPLSPATEERLEVLFPGEDQFKAREMISWLPSYFEKDPVALERIRFALLRLSNGDIEELEEWKDELRSDYRTVLIASGFGTDINAHAAWFPEGPGLETKPLLDERIAFIKAQRAEIARIVELRRREKNP